MLSPVPRKVRLIFDAMKIIRKKSFNYLLLADNDIIFQVCCKEKFEKKISIKIISNNLLIKFYATLLSFTEKSAEGYFVDINSRKPVKEVY